jgi:hypothetical protein
MDTFPKEYREQSVSDIRGMVEDFTGEITVRMPGRTCKTRQSKTEGFSSMSIGGLCEARLISTLYHISSVLIEGQILLGLWDDGEALPTGSALDRFWIE